MLRRELTGIFLLLGIVCLESTLVAQNAICVNVDPAKFTGVLQEAGLVPLKSTPNSGKFEGDVVIWQARGPITDAVAEALGRFVQDGGSLLVGFDEEPGIGVQRLGFMLPTLAWHTATSSERRGEATLTEADPSFFANPEGLKNFGVRFHYEIRPWHAVERGQARYDRYLRPLPYKDFKAGTGNPSASDKANLLALGTNWWTRPLLNRDWKIRARCDDYAQTPLLVTGRYGAGRVAVFASKLDNVDKEGAFWGPVFHWLRERERREKGDLPAGIEMQVLPRKLSGGSGGERSLEVKLTNSGARNAEVLVLGRMLTWEGAIVGDVERGISVPAKGNTVVSLPMPESAGATSYQALEARDEFRVRLGVLSADGRALLTEQETAVDLRPSVLLGIHTKEVRSVERPFRAPPVGKEVRSGLPIYSYTYRRGQSIDGEIVIENGVRNLAPMAKVSDESAPGNPSVGALIDGASRAEAKPDWYALDAWGFYEGKANKENILAFDFPEQVTVSAVTLVGSPDSFRNYLRHNPRSVVIEADGKELAREERADLRFSSEGGVVRIGFQPTAAKKMRVCLAAFGMSPRLAEISIDGAMGPLSAPTAGKVSLVARNALTNETIPVLERDVEVAPLERLSVSFSARLPERGEANLYRLEASFQGQTTAFPILSLDAPNPLASADDLNPPGCVSFGFIVTRGFRNLFDSGTGTQEIGSGWGQPDDLVWAYSRGLKQNGVATRMQANRLYVSDNDMRHYSTPWRNFYNGERFWDVALPLLVEKAKASQNWSKAEMVNLGFSDRWDTGPTLSSAFSWMDFEAFNRYLKAQGKRGLQGRTRSELAREIETEYGGLFNAWQLETYERDLHHFRDRFASEGKRVLIQAQGAPLVPLKQAEVISDVVRGMNDDNTWGMAQSSIPLTTGRQMGILAFNPFLAMTTLGSWGWDDSVLNNVQWRGPVGTTEPSRRHIYDRAFRGLIRPNGSYGSMHTYGYGTNGGIAHTLNINDYNEWQRVEDRQSLLTPDAPIGAGVIYSTAYMDNLETLRISGGGPGGNSADEETLLIGSLVQRMHENGVSLPFSANAASLEKWQGDAPLILVNAGQFDIKEIAALRKLSERGGRIVAFAKAGKPLSPESAAFFGVGADGAPAAGKRVGEFAGRSMTAFGTTLFIPIERLPLNAREGQILAPLVKSHLQMPISFPVGSAGYGFKSNGRAFLVVEDWREVGRIETIRLRASRGATQLRAASVNDHTPLQVKREGDEWLIEVPLRPGDAQLICLEETK